MIELINVSKYYPTDFGRHYVFRNVSLKLPLDKSVGVIGPNGAGKSTFLRLLGGADIPSEGKILRTGRISPPMGLTPGLQASLNGVENARFAGRIYGMDRDEIAGLIDYVRETANIGKFFDMPVGTYSAGMKQRVAFAINMSMTFDYYLFDEIGAGGDREFRRTGNAMIAERLKTSNFIIASHRTDELLDLCESGIVIKDGTLTFYDDITDALAAYNTDDDEDEERLTKRATRRARRSGAEGGEAASAETKPDTKSDTISERKAKRASRKVRKSEVGESGAAADASAAEPPVAAAVSIPETVEAANPPEATSSPDDREARRAKRRTRMERGAAIAPAEEPALAAPDASAAPPKSRSEEAPGAAMPRTEDGLRAEVTVPPPPESDELSLDAIRQARRARKLAAAKAISAGGTEATREPDTSDTAAESREEPKARRARLREARLKAKVAETGQPASDQIDSGSAASALQSPRPPRPRGDEAVGAYVSLQTPSSPDGDRPMAEATSPGETRTGNGVR